MLAAVTVPSCGSGSQTSLDTLGQQIKRLEEANMLPDAAALAEYAENAVLVINATSGHVDREPRIKVRRGHYVVLDVRGGWILDLKHEQSLAEGGSIYEGSPRAVKRGGLVGEGRWGRDGLVSQTDYVPGGPHVAELRELILEQRINAVVSADSLTKLDDAASQAPRARWLLSTAATDLTKKLEKDLKLAEIATIAEATREVQKLDGKALLAAATAIDPQILLETVQGLRGRRAGWLRAAFRESVFRVTIVPYATADGKEITPTSDLSSFAPYVTEIVVTVNAQKWGFGTMAGFLFPVTEEAKFTYQTIPGDVANKRIVESSKSDATPYTGFYVNFFEWARPQWGVSIGIALESEEQRPVYALGLSYLFSRHGSVTLGVALAPEKRLPDGIPDDGIVPVADNTLGSLDTQMEVRPFIGVAWSFGQRSNGNGSETSPKPGTGN